MKKFFRFLLLIVVIGWGIFFFLKDKRREEPKVIVTGEKPFVIVVPSYNNADWCERNLRSIFEQKYSNYRVIYIDDASKDETLEKVRAFIRAEGQGERVTLWHNERNQGAAANFYRAIHTCRDDEIVVLVDGDDWLLHEWVLEKLNEAYADKDVWITYGNYFSYPDFRKGECSKPLPKKVLESNQLREYLKKKGNILSHLKTFYAGLFKQIKLQDFLYEGRFYPSSSDSVMMVPMIEMAALHTKFIKQPLYANNRANQLNDDKVNFPLQQACWQSVKDSEPYSPIPSWKRSPSEECGDCIVFSYDRPMQLYALLESMEKYVTHVEGVTVIYRVSDEAFLEAYQCVRDEFPSVEFVKQGDEADFKPMILQALKEGKSEYVMFAVDDMVIKDGIDLKEAIKMLRATRAHGFYFRLGHHVTYSYANDQEQGVPPAISFRNGIFAWQFVQGKEDWHYPHSVDLVLYKKSEIVSDLAEMKYNHPGKLEEKWAGRPDFNQVGLFYENSKVVTIPLNLVIPSDNRCMKSFTVHELLEKFQEGLKIDISPLHQIKNRSCHIEYEPTFITR